MKSLRRTVLLQFLLVAITAVAHAEGGTLLAVLRGGSPAASQLCKGCEILAAKVEEFGTGNTSVKFLGPVVGRDVVVLISETMTADQLFEALLYVRTARSLGAKSVRVELDSTKQRTKVVDGRGKKINLPLGLLFSVAGAIDWTDRTGRTQNLRQMRWQRLATLEWRSAKFAEQNTGRDMILPGSHPQMAAEISQRLQIPLATSGDRLAGDRVLVASAPVPPVNENLAISLSQLYQLSEQGAESHLFSPYFPYARSDKVDQEGIAVGGRLIADLVEASGARSITYARAHAPQAGGFYQIPARETSSFKTFAQVLRNDEIDIIISPDEGAQKSSTAFADFLGTPIGVINKQRVDGKLVPRGLSLPDHIKSLSDLNVVIPDDETQSGSTMAEAAKEMKARGAAKVIVLLTHLNGHAKSLLDSKHVDKIYVSNSIPVAIRHPKVIVVDLAPEMAEAVKSVLAFPHLEINQCSALF